MLLLNFFILDNKNNERKLDSFRHPDKVQMALGAYYPGKVEK